MWVREGGGPECFGVEYQGNEALFDPPPGPFTDLCLPGSEKSACALDSAGTPTCWGTNTVNPDSGPFRTLTCGGDTYCGVTAAGEARCWGGCFWGVCDVPP